MMRIDNHLFKYDTFDLSSLQTLPHISLNSKPAKNSKKDLNSEYSIVSNFELLPYPFSKTALVTFKSKYKMHNKCDYPLYIIQDDCEESLCLFPHEKSIFHWTSSNKKKEIKIKTDENKVSGPFKLIVQIIRTFVLKLSVTIQEVDSIYLIEFSDASHMPPYRIENMTKHNIYIAQAKTKTDDYT